MIATSLGNPMLTSMEFRWLNGEFENNPVVYETIRSILIHENILSKAGNLTKFGKLAKAEYEERQAQKAQYILPLEE